MALSGGSSIELWNWFKGERLCELRQPISNFVVRVVLQSSPGKLLAVTDKGVEFGPVDGWAEAKTRAVLTTERIMRAAFTQTGACVAVTAEGSAIVWRQGSEDPPVVLRHAGLKGCHVCIAGRMVVFGGPQGLLIAE